jgi:hypothetical protein
MIVGFYCALKSEEDYTSLLMIGILIAFIMYFIVNLPFTNAYQNYRAGVIYISMFVILLTTNYYRDMKNATPLDVKGKIYNPALI